MSGKKEKKAINLIGSKSRKKTAASKKRREAARGQQKTRGRGRTRR